MNNWLDLLILVLAAARLTRLVTTDTIANRFRCWIWNRFGGPSDSAVGYLVTCNWCTGVYTSSLIYLVYKIEPDVAITALTIPAIAMAASFITDRAG